MRRSNRSTNNRAQNATAANALPEQNATADNALPATTTPIIGGNEGLTTPQPGNNGQTPGPVATPIPMTVYNVPQITFHENGEKLFMDDKHIDAAHPNHVQITRAQVENLGQQFRQYTAT